MSDPAKQAKISSTHVEETTAETKDAVPPSAEHLDEPPRTYHVNVPTSSGGRHALMNRIRKILRLEEECVVSGVGNAIASVVEIVTILERENVAVVRTIKTTAIGPHNRPRMEVAMTGGEGATLVSDFRRQKVMEVFEKWDAAMSGALSREQVDEMNFGAYVLADEARNANAVAFLDELQGRDITEPDFIRYASLLIHPLLKEVHFDNGILQLVENVQYDPVTRGDEQALPASQATVAATQAPTSAPVDEVPMEAAEEEQETKAAPCEPSTVSEESRSDERVPSRTEEEEQELTQAVVHWEEFASSAEYHEAKQAVADTMSAESKDQEREVEEFVALTEDSVEAITAATREAEAFTKRLEETPVSGRVDDRGTLLRVMLDSFRQEGRDCLFFDSSSADPIARRGAQHLTAPRQARGQAKSVLKLESASGLAGVRNGVSTKDAAVDLQTAIRSQRPHPTLADVRQRLARAHGGVAVSRVHITGVRLGSLCFDYTVEDCPDYFRNGTIVDNLRGEFNTFKSLKIHPLLVKETFEVTDFDTKGHKSFASENSTFEVGPPGRKKTYTQPHGWCRYGLKVLGKYGDDTWLKPFQHDRNWYRVYHGTNANVGKAIVSGQFRPGNGQAYANSPCVNRPGNVGVGVYCSPLPSTAEGYAKVSTINTAQGTKRFKFMFMCGVDPDVVRITQQADYWVVPQDQPQALRPYGLLLKEV